MEGGQQYWKFHLGVAQGEKTLGIGCSTVLAWDSEGRFRASNCGDLVRCTLFLHGFAAEKVLTSFSGLHVSSRRENRV